MKYMKTMMRVMLASLVLLCSSGTVHAEEPEEVSPPPAAESAAEETGETEEEVLMPEDTAVPEETVLPESTDGPQEAEPGPQETPDAAADEAAEEPAEAPSEEEQLSDELPKEEQLPEAQKTPESPLPEPESEEPEAEDPEIEPEEQTWSDRLIVIGGEIREQDHVISVYEDLTLLGFADGDALQEGYAYYSEHSVHAEADGVILAAENGNLTDAPNEISSENNPIDQLQQLLEEEPAVTAGRTPLIALIDTGAPKDCANIVSAVSVLGDDPYDDNGHGTRMSELILAENPSARILSVKALDTAGNGTMSSVYAAMEYAIGQGADMIALCMSAYVSNENRIIADEIEKAAEQGITVVGAAGNNHLNTKYFIPANVEAAIIAASCDEAGELRDFSNWGDTVDALVVSDSTSEAAAVLCGILSGNGNDLAAALKDARVFSRTGEKEGGEGPVPDPEGDGEFSAQCNTYFYGDAYFWEIPYGETTTKNAKLIAGYQQEVLNSPTDIANGYDVQYQQYSRSEFVPGHGYAVYADTHNEATVSSWGSDVHETDFHGSYEAWGRYFDSARTFTINAKTIPDYGYLGMIVSQNSADLPPEQFVGALSPELTATVRLGETGSIYWDDVPGMNADYWMGWEHTLSGEGYPTFRVDFYYQNARPKHNLTIRYLEEKTEKVLAAQYGPTQVLKDEPYSVSSPKVSGYELVNAKDATVSGTMPDQDLVLTVYYRKKHKILTKVINGTITLNNAMEKAGTTGDSTWKASGAVTDIPAGETRTIRYENRPDYYLDYVKIDGKTVDGEKYPKSYTFKDIRADHEVEVCYAQDPVPDDSKKVQRNGTYIDGKLVTSGEVLTYTVRVKNTFSSTKTFRVEDKIPGRTAYVKDSANEGGKLAGGVLKWEFNLAAGKEKTLSFRITVLPEAKGTIIKNKADVYLNKLKFTTNETENPVMPDPVKHVVNSKGKDVNGKVVAADREVTYRITVKNPADKELEFTVKDPVDKRQTLKPASISDGGTAKGTEITWKIRIPAGKERTVTFSAVPNGYELTIPNKAGVTAEGCKVIETNETVIYTPSRPVKRVTTVSGTDINGKAIAQNEEFLYWITVKNPSATDRTYCVSDTIPSVVQILEAGTYTDRFETGGGSAKISGQKVTWQAVLPKGKEMKCFVRCRLKETDVAFTNQAEAVTDEIEMESNEVRNWSGRIIINAEIEEYWEAYGQPSFLYDIQDGTGQTWHRMIIIDPSTRKGQAVFDIPTGHDADTWKINDEPGSRYGFVRANPESKNVTVSNRTSSAVIKESTPCGITHYLYRISQWNDTSHLAAVINSLEYRRN